MSETMTDAELDALVTEVRSEHEPEGNVGGQHCRDDGYPWPCHAVRFADAITQLRRALAAAQERADNAERERDAAVADNAALLRDARHHDEHGDMVRANSGRDEPEDAD